MTTHVVSKCIMSVLLQEQIHKNVIKYEIKRAGVEPSYYFIMLKTTFVRKYHKEVIMKSWFGPWWEARGHSPLQDRLWLNALANTAAVWWNTVLQLMHHRNHCRRSPCFLSEGGIWWGEKNKSKSSASVFPEWFFKWYFEARLLLNLSFASVVASVGLSDVCCKHVRRVFSASWPYFSLTFVFVHVRHRVWPRREKLRSETSFKVIHTSVRKYILIRETSDLASDAHLLTCTWRLLKT